MSMHYLPAQTVTREYEERIVLRGDDLRAVRNILRTFRDCMPDATEQEEVFIDRFLAATAVTKEGTPIKDDGTKMDPFAAHVAA